MDGFKDSTKVKYTTGGTFNEKGKRATLAELAAEDRRMAGRPSEGVSSRPTDASGRRATNAELGMTSSAKKPVGPSSVAVSKVLAGMTKPVKKALGGAVNSKIATKIIDAKAAGPRAKSTFVDTMNKVGPQKPSSGNPLMGGNMNRDDIVASKHTPPTMVKKPKPELPTREKPTYRDDPPMPPMPTRGPSMSPAFNDRPMIRRKTGGLAVMPGGKC